MQTFSPDHPCRLIPVLKAEMVLATPIALPGYAINEEKCFNRTIGTDERFEFAFTRGARGATKFDERTRVVSERVEGIGTDARWDASKRTLHVLMDEGYLWIEVPSVADPRRAAVQLAEIALERLG